MRRAWLILGVLVGGGCASDSAPVDGDVAFLRDPASGMCLPVPVAVDTRPGSDDPPPWAGWEKCANPCAGLDEATCSADPRCKATFDPRPCPAGAACAPAEFLGCEPNPQPDACLGLDAQTCSATPGCEAIYGGVPCDCADGSKMCACPDIAVYRGCHQVSVTSSCQGDDECGGGRHCSTRDGDCRPHPACGEGRACPAVCTGICVADEPPLGCSHDGVCGPNEHCSVRDGTCFRPPDCNDEDACLAVCYGICVPDDSSCFALGDEKTCVLRSDCEPVYRGERCFCDAQGCGCLDYTFDTCRPRPTPPQGCDPAVDYPTGLTGTWEGSARRYLFTMEGSFVVEDDVAPCPPDAVCVWSGVVTNHGTFTLDASGTVALRYLEPLVKWEGRLLVTQLALKDCARLVEVPGGGVFNRK